MARDQKVVAIGECGLDYFRSDKTGQKEKFEQQISLAVKLGKPLIIHCRDAHEDMLAILAERRPNVPVIMHFFTATGELAQKYLDLGCYLSFPGPITYTTMYDESIRVTPLDKILSETDSPFAAPVPNRGKRNEPEFVTDVVAKIAAVKGLPSDEMASLTVKNAYTVFGLPAGMESLQN
ncbi:MAG: TatD family hydrolase [Patescibacteria group bacterium]